MMKSLIINLLKTKKTIAALKKYLIKHNILLYNEIVSNSPPNCQNFSESLYCYLNNIQIKPHCSICANPVTYKNFTKGYAKYCSPKCFTNSILVQEKRKNTLLQKYGVASYSQTKEFKRKCQQTWLKNYGVDNPNKNSSIRQKIKQTCLQKYGVECTFASRPHRIKSKKTCLEKYGKEYFPQTDVYIEKCQKTNLQKYNTKWGLQSDKIRQKIKQTCLQKYGVDNPFKSQKIQNQISNQSKSTFLQNLKQRIQNNYIPLFTEKDYTTSHNDYKFLCKKCNQVFLFNGQSGFINLNCPFCNPPFKSKPEIKLREYIASIYPHQIIFNSRKIISGCEIDIYLPDKKIAFELHGLYWHSENNSLGPKNRRYHLNKLQLCQSQNIKLIQIFEDEFNNKQKIIQYKIKHLLNNTKYTIYARHCHINIISSKQKNAFLNKYHIQGCDVSNINLGLFYKTHLIAVMTFAKLRKALGAESKTNYWELSRFATIFNFNVIGAAGKLLSYFEKNYSPIQIISYADRRWSEGNLYYKIGFQLDHISAPNYWYMKTYRDRYHRFNFRKNVLKDKLENFDPKLSEWNNMKNNGYDRIWDCGNLMFIKNLHQTRTKPLG